MFVDYVIRVGIEGCAPNLCIDYPTSIADDGSSVVVFHQFVAITVAEKSKSEDHVQFRLIKKLRIKARDKALEEELLVWNSRDHKIIGPLALPNGASEALVEMMVHNRYASPKA